VAALLVPAAGAGAAKPPSGAKVPANPLNLMAPGWSTAKVATGPSLAVSKLTSAPASARPGGAYVLHGTVVNSGRRGASGPVVVHLMRPETKPLVVGRSSVHAAALGTTPYAVTVRIPAKLARGSYSLFSCVARTGKTGPLGCVAAIRRIVVGGGDAVRGTKALANLKTFSRGAATEDCSPGARTHDTVTANMDKLYPQTGNGGYVSTHTDVFQVYDAVTNQLLPGNHVDLTQRATQCLSDFSLDFVLATPGNDAANGPNLTISSITVDGQPATWRFIAPAYPGDPNGPEDPDPLAHQASQTNPVSATNPNPPACSPQLASNSAAGQNGKNGTQCPAEKLVITPAASIPNGSTFVVSVAYTGKPGTYRGGGGTQEGWFRDNTANAQGAMVTTEPVGTMAWMPLNNHPTVKPTYDFHDTVTAGRYAVANGELVGFTDNPPDANFPGGSTTWNWHSPEPVQNYLVENTIGAYEHSMRVGSDGRQYYETQSSAISAARKATNKIAMDNQQDITNFQETLTGPYPATTNGITVVLPNASFEEEMQTKIVFVGGTIGGTSGTSLGTFNHENWHQWWGDSVAESRYSETFFKEGQATISEYFTTARGDATAAGGIGTPAGDTAFENRLTTQFNGTGNYNTTSTTFWTIAPSNPTAFSQFGTSNTYTRGGTAYTALWKIFGKAAWVANETKIQHDFLHGNISEPVLKGYFRDALPLRSASCLSRFDSFWTQWFDTAYGTGGTNTQNRPMLTGPGLNGPGFPCAQITPASPNGANGWYTSPVSAVWTGFPTETSPRTATRNGCVDETVSADGTYSKSCGVINRTTTALSAAAAAGATNVKVASVNGLVAGNTLTIDSTGANPETVTMTTVGTSGAGGTGVTFTPALAFAHASGAANEFVLGNSGLVSESFKIDATAPTTVGTIAPASPDGQNGWYLSPPTVTLAPSDATSGLASTQYSLDGGPWTVYFGPISPSGEGGHSLQFYSVDKAGNQEAPQTITWAVDTTAPTTTATLAPGIRNGWYASPTLTLSVNDGRGSGDITDPCPPRVLCGFATLYSLDGGPFVAYTGPLSGFSTGNHFVQFHATDVAGHVEATKLVAFKVDAVAPSVTVTRPADGETFPLNKVVTAAYKCVDRESGLDTCVGTVPNGSNLDTSTTGDHAFTVTATDKAGNQTVVTHHYQVVPRGGPAG